MQVITDAKELRKHTYKKVRNTNIMHHHPRKAYPSRSRGRLTGRVMGKHRTADAAGGARKAWPGLSTAEIF